MATAKKAEAEAQVVGVGPALQPAGRGLEPVAVATCPYGDVAAGVPEAVLDGVLHQFGEHHRDRGRVLRTQSAEGALERPRHPHPRPVAQVERRLDAPLGDLVEVEVIVEARGERLVHRRDRRHPADGVVQRADWDALEAQAHPLLKWRSTVLKEGSRGWPVKAVQRNLGVTSDGYFGARTMLAVKALQQRHGLAGTGVVASRTWRALEVEVVARANR